MLVVKSRPSVPYWANFYSGYHYCVYSYCAVTAVFMRSEYVLFVVDMTPPPPQPISLRLDNVLPVVNQRHVQLLGPQVCTIIYWSGPVNST